MLSTCAQSFSGTPSARFNSNVSNRTAGTVNSPVDIEAADQADAISATKAKPGLTILTALGHLNSIHKTYEGSRLTAPDTFAQHYTFISVELIDISRHLLGLTSNIFSESEFAEFSEKYKSLCRKVRDLKAIRPELRRIDEAMSRLEATLTDQQTDDAFPDRPRLDIDGPGHQQTSFKSNIRTGLSLLKNEHFGFGRNNAVLNELQFLVNHEGIQDLQLSQLFTIIASLDKLQESEMDTAGQVENGMPTESDVNPKIKVIQLLRQVVFAEVNKEQANHLKRLKNGLHNLSAALSSFKELEKEKKLVRLLQKKWAEVSSEDSDSTQHNVHDRPLRMFELSQMLTKLTGMLQAPSHPIGTEEFIKIQEEISALQKIFSIIPSAQIRREVITEESREAELATQNRNQKKIQDLKDILSMIHGPLKTWRDKHCLRKLNELLLLVSSYDSMTLRPIHWLTLIDRLTNISIELESSPQKHSGMLEPIQFNVQRALSICEERLRVPECDDTNSASNGASVLNKTNLADMLKALEPLFHNSVDEGNSARYRKLIAKMIQLLRPDQNSELVQLDFEKIIAHLDFITDDLDLILAGGGDTRSLSPEHIDLINFAKQNIAHISGLCEISSSKSEAQLNPKSRFGFLKIFKHIRCALKGIDNQNKGYASTLINPIMDSIYTRLLAAPVINDSSSDEGDNELTIEDWEFISRKLELITKTSDHALGGFDPTIPSEDFIHNGFKIGFIKKNIQCLALISGAEWAARSQAKIVDYLTYVIYIDKWDQSYSSMVTQKLGVNVNVPFFLVSGGINVAKMDGEVTDDEGYPGRLSTKGGGGNLSLDLGVHERVRLAKIGLEGGRSGGDYEEWDSNRKKVIANFQTLIKDHRKDPYISAYLKRGWVFDATDAAATAEEKPAVDQGSTESEATVDAEEAIKSIQSEQTKKNKGTSSKQSSDTTEKEPPPKRIDQLEISLENIDEVQSFHDLQSEHMSQLFSTLIDLRHKQTLPRFAQQYASDRGKIQTSPLGLESAGGLKLKYSQTTGSVTGEVGLIAPGIDLSVMGAATGTKTEIVLLRDNPLCRQLERFCDGEDYNVKSKSQRLATAKEIRDEVTRKSAGLREKLDHDALQEKWRKEQRLAKTAVLNKNQKEKLAKYMAEKTQDRRNVWSRAPLSDLMTSPVLDIRGRPVQSDVITHEIETLQRALNNLQMDFERYTHLQSQLHHGDTFTASSIEAMHAMYGIPISKIDGQNKEARHVASEKFMYRMLLLTAWLYSRAQEVDEIAPKSMATTETLKKKLIHLEKSMHNCKFAIDKQTLNQMSTYHEECLLQTQEAKFTATAKANVFEVLSSKIELEARFRTRYHVNPLRHGYYRDIEIRLSPGFNLLPKSQMMEYIRGQVAQNGPECGPLINEMMEKYLDSTTISTGGLTFNFRWFKPSLFPGLDFSFWNLRVNQTADVTFGLTSPTPIVQLSYKYDSAKTSFVTEVYPSHSILYFALRYYHDYTIKDIKSNGDITSVSYWATVKEKQKKTLEKLLLNVGNAEASRRAADKPGRVFPVLDCNITRELDAIEAEIGKISKNREEHTRKIETARKALMEAAVEYSKTQDEVNYEAALKAFENLMLAYSPRLITLKKKSGLFTPKDFSLLSTD